MHSKAPGDDKFDFSQFLALKSSDEKSLEYSFEVRGRDSDRERTVGRYMDDAASAGNSPLEAGLGSSSPFLGEGDVPLAGSGSAGSSVLESDGDKDTAHDWDNLLVTSFNSVGGPVSSAAVCIAHQQYETPASLLSTSKSSRMCYWIVGLLSDPSLWMHGEASDSELSRRPLLCRTQRIGDLRH